ncbi:vWA domain-containing protein [Catellatospora citrea]|uniref:vWA domain-containing protein n=1 Tax=Catellatospora citrea TaxID=53366 RepID=UPI0033FD6284
MDLAAQDTRAYHLILLDTSGSMATKGLYPRVHDALLGFLSSLPRNDTIAVLPFAGTPGAYCERSLAEDVYSIVRDCVPPDAKGDWTDLGGAFAAALDHLSTVDVSLSSLIVVTDDEHDPGPDDSDYPPPAKGVPAWDVLAARARSLPGVVVPYALQLAGGQSAKTMSTVFGNVVAHDATSQAEIVTQLTAIRTDIRMTVARDAYRRPPPGATAAWEGVPDGVDCASGAAEAQLTFAQGNPLVPVAVTDLAVTADGFPATVTGIPARVELSDGVPANIRVHVTWHTTDTASGTLRLVARVSSPYADGLRQLDVPVATAPAGETDTAVSCRTGATSGASGGWVPPTLTTALLASVLTAAVVFVRRRRGFTLRASWAGVEFGPVRPSLVGDRFGAGSWVRLRSADGQELPGHGTLQPIRTDDRTSARAYKITYSPDSSPARADETVLPANGSIMVNGVVFTHQDETTSRRSPDKAEASTATASANDARSA